MGTPYLAAKALKQLIESRHEVIAVVTQPDKASGRGMKVNYSPVKQVALDAGIPVLQPALLRAPEAVEELRALSPELIVVAAYSQLLPQSVLDMAPYGCINIHPSLLPKYRGAAPLRGAIFAGDPTTGVTIMKMAAKLDAGDILLQKELEMDPKETVTTLTPKVAELGGKMLVEVIDLLERGEAAATPQDDAASSYIKQLEKEDGRIRFEKDAAEIERQIRGCDPWPSAFTKLDGKTFKIWDADVIPEEDERLNPAAEAGSAAYVDKKTLIIKCGKGGLKLNEVQIEGKRRMTIEEFLRGKKIEKGQIFG